jgi:hypothetical protein
MMAKTFAGAKIYIGTTADATNQSMFEADSYTEIKNVSNMGEFGASANIVQFPTVSDDFVQKSKGTRNAGDPALVVGRLPNDPGQLAMRAAEQTKYRYNFKLELEDAESEEYTNTVIYFRALVAGVPMQFGGNEDFVTETYQLGIYPRPLIIESALITP